MKRRLREDLFTFPGMGTEKKRVQNSWPAPKLRIRLELGLEDGKEIEVHLPDFLLSMVSVSRDIVSLVSLAETKWWELGTVV